MQLITIFEIHDVLRRLRPIKAVDDERCLVFGDKSAFDKSLWLSDVHHAAVLLFPVGSEISLTHANPS